MKLSLVIFLLVIVGVGIILSSIEDKDESK
jgi:hypothetical protein